MSAATVPVSTTEYEAEVTWPGETSVGPASLLISDSEYIRPPLAFTLGTWADEQRDHLDEQLHGLLRLMLNWDSYGALPISREAVRSARSLVIDLASIGIPIPAVRPSTDGAVRLEWTDEVREVMLEVSPQGCTVYYCDESDPEIGEYEGPLGADSRWTEVLVEIVEPSLNV